MGRFNQAPRLVNKKPKMDNNIIMLTNDMYYGIMKQIGSKYRAGHVLIWLIGQADGFGVAEKTVMNAIGISSSAYHSDIRFLADLGLITYIQGKSITINYDKILGDRFEQSKNRVIKSNSLNQSVGDQINQSILENRVIESDSLSEGDRINQSILGDQFRQSILISDQFEQSRGDRFNQSKGVQINQDNIEEHINNIEEGQEFLGDKIEQSIGRDDDFDYVQDAINSYIEEQQQKWVF